MTPVLKPFKKITDITNIGNDWIGLRNELKRSASKFVELTDEVKKIGDKAGNTEVLQQAVKRIKYAVQRRENLANIIDSSLYIRAVGIAAIESGSTFPLNQELFNHIDQVRAKPSIILVESLRQHFLLYYDQLVDFDAVQRWLLSALKRRQQITEHDPQIISKSGAKWFASECIRKNIELNNLNRHIGLDNYQTGRFFTVAQQIYYVERLREIPANHPHPLLEEVQKYSIYTAPYDEHGLLGHEILKILISRAPTNGVHDTWRNVVMQIAGDPRIPKSHPRYQKWWLHLNEQLRQKVISWLSDLDLRLFLEALEDYSMNSDNEELIRMYPARKRFLQGLLDRKLVTGTRLYLTSDFLRYLHKHYKEEHLPELYRVNTNDKSIIYVQLTHAHLIEGSHSCQLWIYRGLTEKAIVFNYEEKSASYNELTSELAHKMRDEKRRSLLVDNIRHHPALTWQNKALAALEKTGITISPEDVLTEADYFEYKRKFGVTL